MISEGLLSIAIADRFFGTHRIVMYRQNIERKSNLKNAGELTSAAVPWLMETG